ncbi:MAG: hypothetical protein MRZ18_00735 [Clostridiales bacterium]|nr:hypothetical protein [Clostridiales bacterium]
MKKLLALLLLMAFLAGCAAAPAETTAPSVTTAPTTVSTTAPTTVPTTVPTEPPKTAPTEPVVEDHDTYFSHVVATLVYKNSSGYYSMKELPVLTTWYTGNVRAEDIESGRFELGTEGFPYYYDKNKEEATLMYTEPTLGVVGDGKRFLAVTQDRTKLVMMYPTGEYQVLWESPDGRLQSGDFIDQCVYFLDAVDEDHDGLYRIYLVDGTVERVLDDLPRSIRDGEYVYGTVQLVRVISNVEVELHIDDWDAQTDMRESWTEPCIRVERKYVTPQAYYALLKDGEYVSFDQYLEDLRDPDCPWTRYDLALHKLRFQEQGKCDNRVIYWNFSTNTKREAGYYSTIATGGEFIAFYPSGERRSSEMLNSNSGTWWLDPYYTGK